ncbi:MAG TPA: hypothetical protein VF211_16195 [Burkholderiales bacterium]
MRTVRNFALASGSVLALALALGAAALAEEAKQPAQKHEHGDAEHAKHHAEHMRRMGAMHDEMHRRRGEREPHGKHEHSQPPQGGAGQR